MKLKEKIEKYRVIKEDKPILCHDEEGVWGPKGKKYNVVSGAEIFHLTSTYGTPLDIIIDLAYDRGILIYWPDFVTASLLSGWNPRTIVSSLFENNRRVFGEDVAQKIKEVADNYIAEVKRIRENSYVGE